MRDASGCMLIDLLEISVNGLDLFVGQKVSWHDPRPLVDTLLQLFKRCMANIGAAERNIEAIRICILGNELSRTCFAMTDGTAGSSGVLVEHLAVFKFRDKIFALPPRNHSDK